MPKFGPRLQIETGKPPGRKIRRPQHPFYLRQRAWGITPFFIAPVLPGDTLESLTVQSRTVTDPIKNALTGWWLEHYVFYVKLVQLFDGSEYMKMLTNPNYLADPVEKLTDNTVTYFQGADKAIDYVEKCLRKITEVYFREPSEAWNVAMVGSGLTWPAAQLMGNSVFDSVMLKSNLETATPPELTVGVDDKFTGKEVQDLLNTWQLMQMNNLTDQSYEEFLATYGIAIPEADADHPELVAFWRSWQYPVNTINPATGIPASAVSWSIAQRTNKKRFFKEPGFLAGITVCRPKVYLKNQVGTFTGLMNNVAHWLPPVMRERWDYTIRDIPIGTVVNGQAAAAVWDARDLFLYGEQFTNTDLTAAIGTTTAPVASLPVAATMKARYPTAATDEVNLFTEVAIPGNNWIRSDGIVGITMLSSVDEMGVSTGA